MFILVESFQVNPVRHFLIKEMSFSIFRPSYHAQITQNKNFFKASTHDIYAALGEESGQGKCSKVNVEKTETLRKDEATVQFCICIYAGCLECSQCRNVKEEQNPSSVFFVIWP